MLVPGIFGESLLDDFLSVRFIEAVMNPAIMKY